MHVKESDFEEVLFQTRKNALSEACTVLVCAPPTVGALAAARIWLTMLRQDFVQYKLVPIFNNDDLRLAADNYVIEDPQIRTVILIECGATVDLTAIFPVRDDLHVFVIDSHRPFSLENIALSPNIYVFDDGEIEGKMGALIATYKTELARLDEMEHEDDEEDDEDEDAGDFSDKENAPRTAGRAVKRKRHDPLTRRQRRRVQKMHLLPEVQAYMTGSYYGKSAAELLFQMAIQAARDSMENLWLGIVGLTEQLINDHIPFDAYTARAQELNTHVNRMSTANNTNTRNAPRQQAGDIPDIRIKHVPEEYRFMLFRHWSVYESMFHTPYVASRLNIWAQNGKETFHKLLASMGASLAETREPYMTMDMDIKERLLEKLKAHAPNTGLPDFHYPSFVKEIGFRTAVSPADVVYAVAAVLEAPPNISALAAAVAEDDGTGAGAAEGQAGAPTAAPVDRSRAVLRDGLWSANFFRAYDVLDPNGTEAMDKAIQTAINFQRALVRLGTTILERKTIGVTRNFRLVKVDGDADAVFFQQPMAATRLASFIMQICNEFRQDNRPAKKSPLVLSVLNKVTNTYLIVGVMNTTRGAEWRKNPFGIAFEKAVKATRVRMRGYGFDSSVIEVKQADQKVFVDQLLVTR